MGFFMKFIIAGLMLFSTAKSLNFCTDAQIHHVTKPDHFPARFCWDDTGTETIARVDIKVNDSVNDTIIYRIDQQLDFTTVSSRMSFSEPWINGSRTCCRHRPVYEPERTQVLNSTASFDDPFMTLPLNRPDGYNLIKLLPSNYIHSTIDILKGYDQANELCPLPCTSPADFVMLVDASSSIDPSSGSNGPNWRKMRNFIKEFTGRFSVSPFNVRLGLTYFAGYQACSNNKCRSDDFCLPIPNLNRTTALSVWNNALTNDEWMDGIDWLNPSTASSQYSCWSGTTNNAGYASVELYVSDNVTKVYSAIDRINNVRAYTHPRIQFTAIGSGITLSKQLFDRTESRGPDAPRILVILTDGVNNCGESVLAAANSARNAGIEIFVVGIGPSISQTELLMIAGNNPLRVFNTNFDTFANIIDPIVSITCTGRSNDAKECPSCNRLCTQCGECINCATDNDCSPCEFCVDGDCFYDETFANSFCANTDHPNQCQKSVCDSTALNRNEMCTVEKDTDEIQKLESQCVGLFNPESCQCVSVSTTTSTPQNPDDDDELWWLPLSIVLPLLCACCLLCLLCSPLLLICFCLMLPIILLPFAPLILVPLLVLSFIAGIILLIWYYVKGPISIYPLTSDPLESGVIVENPLAVACAVEGMNPLAD